MHDDDIRYLGDFDLCHQCIEGSRAAITHLRELTTGPCVAYLVSCGGKADEARDLVDSLWADLLAPPGTGRPRMSHYNGRCAFQSWFNTVALNRLISKKRKQARWSKLFPKRLDEGGPEEETAGNNLAHSDSDEPDNPLLIGILRDAIEYAFRNCDPEDFVLLHLRYIDGVFSKELAVMFQCEPPSISKRLTRAKDLIAVSTKRRVQEKDPWLELKWRDFVELCRTATPAAFGLD